LTRDIGDLFGTVPLALSVPPFALASLNVADVDEDYAAVMESADVLQGMLGGDWPAGLTHAGNLADLRWHEEETATGRSYAWVIRTADGAYAGCAYLKQAWDGGEGLVAPYWFRTGFGDRAAIERFDRNWRAAMVAIVGEPVRILRRSAFHRA
jgi:hypothetical protein